MLNSNLIVIELTNDEYDALYDTGTELTEFLYKMNISEPDQNDIKAFPPHTESSLVKNLTLGHKLYLASMACITGKVWTRVWINPENGYVIAYQDYEGKKFSEHFIDYIENTPTLDKGDTPLSIKRTNNNLTLDIVLEKIFKDGLESLTMEEVNFLAEFSKDL